MERAVRIEWRMRSLDLAHRAALEALHGIRIAVLIVGPEGGRHVTFYVAAHNSEIPHSAFRGQTPDEMYYGRGAEVPVELEAARRTAMARRLERNRAVTCAGCSGMANRIAAVA